VDNYKDSLMSNELIFGNPTNKTCFKKFFFEKAIYRLSSHFRNY